VRLRGVDSFRRKFLAASLALSLYVETRIQFRNVIGRKSLTRYLLRIDSEILTNFNGPKGYVRC
jgi:hypothetical protein